MQPDILRQRIQEIPGFPFDYDSIQIEAEALENVLASMPHRKNPSSWVAVERIDFTDLPSERTAALLLSFPFREKTVEVVWLDLHAGIVLPFEDFVRFFGDLWFPSSDDVVVIDPRHENLLEISHEEFFTLFHRKQIAGMSINLQPDTPQECFDLARRYDSGLGVAQDAGAAIHWHRRAAELGHAEAQAEMGWRLFRGAITPRDDDEMIRFYRAAADQGNPKAIGELGRCSMLGRGVPKNVSEAVRLYRISAEKGYAEAAKMLARCYKLGTGVEKNDDEASKWFSHAGKLESEHLFAGHMKVAMTAQSEERFRYQCYVAGYYAAGFGVAQNFDKAIEWYLKAAESKSKYAVFAQFELGLLLIEGPEEIHNIQDGRNWIEQAAEQGYPEAVEWLKQNETK